MTFWKLLCALFAHFSHFDMLCFRFISFHSAQQKQNRIHLCLYYAGPERYIGVSADERLCKFAINFSFCKCMWECGVFSTLPLLRFWFTPKNIEEMLPYKLLSNCAFHLPSIYIRTRIEAQKHTHRIKTKCERKKILCEWGEGSFWIERTI